jgi:hypothetical protein
MKAKTTNETSGTSPTKVSENGAPIQTGAGLSEVARRIEDAFAKIRQHSVQGPVGEPTPLTLVDLESSSICREAERKAKVEKYAGVLISSAMRRPVVNPRPLHQPRAFVIEAPVEDAQTLIDEALRRFK